MPDPGLKRPLRRLDPPVRFPDVGFADVEGWTAIPSQQSPYDLWSNLVHWKISLRILLHEFDGWIAPELFSEAQVMQNTWDIKSLFVGELFCSSPCQAKKKCPLCVIEQVKKAKRDGSSVGRSREGSLRKAVTASPSDSKRSKRLHKVLRFMVSITAINQSLYFRAAAAAARKFFAVSEYSNEFSIFAGLQFADSIDVDDKGSVNAHKSSAVEFG